MENVEKEDAQERQHSREYEEEEYEEEDAPERQQEDLWKHDDAALTLSATQVGRFTLQASRHRSDQKWLRGLPAC